MSSKPLLASLVFLVSLPLLSQTASQTASPAAAGRTSTPRKSTTTPPAQQHQSEGDRIFQANCSRCHNAPEGFSSRISGTVIRHMRVRASLSKHDEDELLHFLNP